MAKIRKDVNQVAVDAPVKGSTSLNTMSSLSATQRQRFSYLVRLFNSSTMKLVTLIEGRGRNSWIRINRKINILEHADFELQRYHDVLYDNFDIGRTYTSSDIIGIVGDIRRDLRLEPYISRLRTNCHNDLFALFIVVDVIEDVVINGESKKKLIGYRPTFSLRPEDQD